MLGVLDPVVNRKLRQHSALYQLRLVRDAGRERALPRQRNMVAGELETKIQQR